MSIGRNALYFEDYVLSIQYFSQIINIKPYLAEPYMYRAIAKIQLGDYQGAEQDCTEAITLNPFIPQAYYTRGFARQRLDYYAEAADDFSKALEFSPANDFFLMNRIRARELNGDYQGALNDLEKYIQANTKKTELYFEHGRLLMALNDTIEAERSFNRYIEADSASSAGWSALALLKMQKNDVEGALHDYNKAIEKKSTFAGDYINRGIIHVQKYNYNQALSDYDTAIRLDKSSVLAHYNRALLRANLGDTNNALNDLDIVLSLDTTQTEALFRKAMLEASIGNYRQATADYKQVLKQYPHSVLVYQGLAEVEAAKGNTKEAFRYRQTAYNIETSKKKDEESPGQELAASNKMSTGTQQISAKKRSEFFNRFAAQNLEDTESDGKYTGALRGAIQNRNADVMNEGNFVLSYYAKRDELRRTPLYHLEIDRYNKTRVLGADLKLTNNELPLTEELINRHFAAIDMLSQQLDETQNADLFFSRAIEFALIQDFDNAVSDLNKAIALRPNFIPAYFLRANIRYKALESKQNDLQEVPVNLNESPEERKKSNRLAAEAQYKYDVELIMRDYDKVIELSEQPFPYAWFNKANMLCVIQDFKSAIGAYTKAIESEPDFAEAYFNRGLTYLYIGEDEKGLADLSKAGELGVVSAYNLILRFKQ